MDKKKIVNESIDYIIKHLDEELSIDKIAAHVFVSKYYFSRIFKEETGESIYAFIKRSRVEQSAIDIKLNPEKSITDIGLEYGYSSSNYSSLFKKQRNVSPIKFKQTIPTHSMEIPFSPERVVQFKTAQEYDENIEVKELDDFLVIYERFIGNYVDLEKHWYDFLERYKMFIKEETILIERFFNDPAITSSKQCMCDICMTVDMDCDMSNVTWIKGGRVVVYNYDGKINDIFETLQGIFSVWMPQSGYIMAERYGLNIYRDRDKENHKVVIDLCIPIS